MSPKTDTEVIIGGKVFTLSGYESEDYMQKIASYINGKITEYGKLDGFRRQPLDKQNILLQLNIADDYFKAKKQISILEEELQGKEKELYDLKHELISAQIKLENAEKELAKMKKTQTAPSLFTLYICFCHKRELIPKKDLYSEQFWLERLIL